LRKKAVKKLETAGFEKLFSRAQIDEHLNRHSDDRKKLKEIEARIFKAGTAFANSTYCQLRSLKKEQAYAVNSVRLHEYYFTSLGGEAAEPPPEMLQALNRDFVSEQEWQEQFVALGMCSRGWVVLGFDLTGGKLQNYFTDDHTEGVWLVLPLLVMDVCEHAYCRDYADRLSYINDFVRNIDWKGVCARYRAARELYGQYGKIF